MPAISIYKCLCDETRLRILNLLKDGPLCVCHLQEILEEPQVRMSKQLAYMKKNGLLTSTREGHWMIYSLKVPLHPLLEENLKCLQDCQEEFPFFTHDLKKKATLLKEADCPAQVKHCC